MDIIFKTPGQVVYDNLDQKQAVVYALVEFGVVNPKNQNLVCQVHFGKDLNGETFNRFRSEKVEISSAEVNAAYTQIKATLSSSDFFGNINEVMARAVQNKLRSGYYGSLVWNESNLDGTDA